jgi:hypothetical protein
MAGGIAFRGSRQPVPLKLPTHSQEAGPTSSGRLTLRLRVLLKRTQLDLRLAEGADPAETATLMLRARQLQGTRQRRALANGLERAIAQAKRYSGSNVDSPISREEVARAHPLLLRLAERLRNSDTVSPRGVVILRRLLTDTTSPIFSPGWSRARAAPGELERQARAALSALDERPSDPGIDRSRR